MFIESIWRQTDEDLNNNILDIFNLSEMFHIT